MAGSIKPRTMARNILQKIDGIGEHLKVIRDVPSAAANSYSGNVPFWRSDLYSVTTPDETDPAAEPLVLAEMDCWRLTMSKPKVPMPYTRRNVAADEMFFRTQYKELPADVSVVGVNSLDEVFKCQVVLQQRVWLYANLVLQHVSAHG